MIILLEKLPMFQSETIASTTHFDHERTSSQDSDDSVRSARNKRPHQDPTIKDPRVRQVFNTVFDTDNPLRNDQIRKYFDQVGRNVDSLTIVYLLTEDICYLNELRDYQASPAALKTLAQFGTDSNQALTDALQLIQLEPHNPMGHYLAATWQAYLGDAKSAVASINEVLNNKDAIHNDLDAQRKKLVSALETMGFGSTEATLYLATHNSLYSGSGTAFRRMIDGVINSPTLTEDERAGAASNLLLLCSRLTNLAESSTNAFPSWCINENMILRELPSDFEYGNDGKTVAARMIELETAYKNEISLAEKCNEALKLADPDVIDEFSRLVELSGWIGARQWLLSR